MLGGQAVRLPRPAVGRRRRRRRHGGGCGEAEGRAGRRGEAVAEEKRGEHRGREEGAGRPGKAGDDAGGGGERRHVSDASR